VPVRKFYKEEPSRHRRVLRSANVRVPGGLQACDGLYSGALIVFAVTAFAACGSGDSKPNVDDLGDNDNAKCSPDDFNSLTQTRPATENVAVSDTICPQQDQDYWQINGAGGTKKLINVNLEYDKLSSIELQADVWGPRGRCMPNALTNCTSGAE